MNVKKIARELKERVFDENYTCTLKAAYDAEIADGQFDALEEDYTTAQEYLSTHLTNDQKELLNAIENRFEENRDYAGRYPFICGMVHAFEQFFSKAENYSFDYGKTISEGLSTIPGMRHHVSYYSNATVNCSDIETLHESVDEETSEHITSIACAWEQRIHSATIHSFFLGYHTSLSMIEEIKPLGAWEMIDKILVLEYELGFTVPYSQRESMKERNAG